MSTLICLSRAPRTFRRLTMRRVIGGYLPRQLFLNPSPLRRCVSQMGGVKQIIRGVVFGESHRSPHNQATNKFSDMDGTLTVPVIDFGEMRRRAGIPTGQDILDAINSWTDTDRREKAFAVIAEIEEEALLNMKVMPGCMELCGFLDDRNVPRGLITRNVKRGITHFHQHHFTPLKLQEFQPAISRECEFKYKPHPDALLHICETWKIHPSECIMVGDSIKDDIVSGNRAGAVTVLLDFNGKAGHQKQQLLGEEQPTHVVTSLSDIIHLLQQDYDLQPAPNPRKIAVPGDT